MASSKGKAGITREQVVAVILGSQECRSNSIDGFYSTYLHRKAEQGEIEFALKGFALGATSDDVLSLVLATGDYA